MLHRLWNARAVAVVVGLLWGASAAAGPVTADTVREAVGTQIVELADFYRRLDALAKSDPVLARIAFDPRKEVALAGGVCREIAWTLVGNPTRRLARLNEVHSADRDLDVLYLGAADGDDEAHVLGVVRDTLQETLAAHGAVVMRIDAHSLREKEEESLLGRQGYDTVSQALVTPAALYDLAHLLKLQPADESTAALLDPAIVYRLPQGALEPDAQFLHQLVQAIRIFKIAAEFPTATVPEETRRHLRTILAAYAKRQGALEAFVKASAERGDNYFRNRIGDVFSALLRLHGGGALYKELDAEFGLSKFAPLRALAANAAVVRRSLSLLSTSAPTVSELDRVLRPGERYPMGSGFSFDPEKRQILYAQGRQSRQVGLALTPTAGGAEGRAFSGPKGPVEPELLPVDKWETLRVRRFQGTLWVVIARNRRTDYHVAGILDVSKGESAEILFLNNRSFSAQATNGNYLGKRGPMIGMLDATATRTGLVGFGANRVFSQLTLTSGSFKIEPFPVPVPMRARVAAFEVEDGVVYFLAADGQLYALSETGSAELLFENVLGIAKGEQGLLAYVHEMPAKTPALYVFERGARSYRRLPFPPHPTDAAAAEAERPLAIAGNDGVTVLRRNYDDLPLAALETPGLAYLRRPETELLAELRSLIPRLPPGADIGSMFAQISAATQAPMELTDDDRPTSKRVGILTKFATRVLAEESGPEARALLGEIFLLRSILELRRGRTPAFGYAPNTFLVPALFKLAAEYASPKTLPVLAELASGETIDELIARDPTTNGGKTVAIDPRAVFFVKQAASTHFGPTCMTELAH